MQKLYHVLTRLTGTSILHKLNVEKPWEADMYIPTPVQVVVRLPDEAVLPPNIIFEQRRFGTFGDYKPSLVQVRSTNKLPETLWRQGLYLNDEVIGTVRPGRTAPRLIFRFDTEEVSPATEATQSLLKKVTQGEHLLHRYECLGFVSLYLKPLDAW